MSRFYKWGLLSFVFMLLAGCSSSRMNRPINNSNFFDHYLVSPVSFLLDWFANHLAGQYGLSILFVTILVRLIILPLSLKQYRSSKQMQALQPELKKLKEKYKSDTKKQQEETMKLFQQNGVNPLAGCFPLIIQMPILYALYNAIMRNPNIHEHTFLWMKLSAPDPWVLPIIAALTTWGQQQVMSKQNPMNTQMKGIMYIFPIMIFVMAKSFPSALPLYWIYGNIFMIVQTYFMYGGGLKKGGKAK